MKQNCKEIHHRIIPIQQSDKGMIFTIFIQIPMSLGWIERVKFSVGTNEEKSVYQLKHIKNEEEYAFFETKLELETKALYYYYFSFEASGKFQYYKKENITGNTSMTKEEQWKLDVNFWVPEWAKGVIMYHIFVDRFRHSPIVKMKQMIRRVIHNDWNEDPVLGPDENGYWNIDFFGGNLKGIEESLDYIKSLGVTILYLSPIVYGQSNHRYDTSDYEKVDPYAGCEKHLKELCNSAHQRGMKVILDGVFNHTGSDSKYFNKYGTFPNIGAYQSEKSPYYSFFKRIWNQGKSTFSYWWGMDNLPECNGNSEEWQEYICGKGGIIDLWFSWGIDGIRGDVVDELTDHFIERILEAIRRNKPDGFFIGEVWKNPMRMNRGYLSSGKGMHSVMNYLMIDALIRYFKYVDTGKLESVMKEILEEYPTQTIQSLMNFTSTHDISRMIEILGCNCFQRFGEWAWNLQNDNLDWIKNHKMTEEEIQHGKRLLKTYVFALIFLPGIFSIFYGDEVGLQGIGNLANRAPYPWGREDKEILEYFRHVVQNRTKNIFLKTAETKILSVTPEYFMFERYNSEQRILVVISRTHHEVPFQVPVTYEKAVVIDQLNNSTKDRINPYGAIAMKLG